MATTSRFDRSRTVEFYGGAWDGKQYAAFRDKPLPMELFMPHGGRTYWYRLRPYEDGVRYEHCGTCLADGSTIR